MYVWLNYNCNLCATCIWKCLRNTRACSQYDTGPTLQKDTEIELKYILVLIALRSYTTLE